MKSLFTSAALMLILVFGLFAFSTPVIAQNAPPTTSSDKQSSKDQEKESDPIKMLLKEVDRVHAPIVALRRE